MTPKLYKGWKYCFFMEVRLFDSKKDISAIIRYVDNLDFHLLPTSLNKKASSANSCSTGFLLNKKRGFFYGNIA